MIVWKVWGVMGHDYMNRVEISCLAFERIYECIVIGLRSRLFR